MNGRGEVGRRGKYLLFGLSSGRTLVVHLRMTGWFHHRRRRRPRATDARHLRARFVLDDGSDSCTPTSGASAR